MLVEVDFDAHSMEDFSTNQKDKELLGEFVQKTGRFLLNIPGWRTKRKIIVFESDDWGSIRMPSREAYLRSLRAGYPVNKIAYERYDALLSHEDLEFLFDLLRRYKDNNGNHPVITANCVVANPDFEKIANSDFKKYYYELITETFKKYPNHQNNFKLWISGMESGVFFPQFHAREHLNVRLFMEALSNGDKDAHWGFANKMPGSIPRGPRVKGNPYVESLRFTSEDDKNEKLAIMLEGLEIFEKLFGFKSKSITPPNYIWSPDFDEPIKEAGVMFFKSIRKTLEPVFDGESRYHNHFLGQRNCFGQVYLVRNAVFEPSLFGLGIKDSLQRCLSDISIAFQLNKPAIISCHRINFSGFIDETNRDINLNLLGKLLKEVTKRWPNVEFMNSVQLGDHIKSSEN